MENEVKSPPPPSGLDPVDIPQTTQAPISDIVAPPPQPAETETGPEGVNNQVANNDANVSEIPDQQTAETTQENDNKHTAPNRNIIPIVLAVVILMALSAVAVMSATQ